MIEREIDLSAIETEPAETRPQERSRSKRPGWIILVPVLLLLLIGVLAYGLYSGSFSRLALQNLQEEGEKLQSQIQELTAGNAEKDDKIEACGADEAERDEELASLNAENAEKSAQLEGLSAENTEKASQLEALSAENAEKNSSLEGLSTENAEKAAQAEALSGENAEMDARIEALNTDLASKDQQIADFNENLPVISAEKDAQIEALTAENAEKDARIDTLNADVAARDAQLETLAAEDADRDARLQDLDAEIAEKDAQLDALTGQLEAANAPLLYLESLRETIPAAAREAAFPEALENESEEMRTALVSGLLQTVLLGKDPEETREDHLAFRIWTADGQLVGSVAFEPVAGEGSELPVWTAVEERYDFSGCDFSDYFQTASVIVPADYQVYMGDTLLGSEWIREEGLPYACYSACPEIMEDLPVLVRYETPPFLGEPALRIFTEKGQELSPEELSESLFLDRCPQEIRERVEAFLPDFCNLFLLFSADIFDSANYYYQQLKPMVLPDSILAARLRDAFEGLGYSAAREAVFDSVTVHGITDLGGGRYAVELSYLSYVTGHSRSFEPVEDEMHLLLILTLTEDDRLLAEALYYL